MTWVHTILWSVELGFMYQPRPGKYISTWKKRYWEWGVGATALLTFLFLHFFRRVQRWTGYEFFRKSHEFISVLFLGACWGHWPEMREWMIAGIAIVFFDRFVRYLRILLIHMNWVSSNSTPFGFHSFDGIISRYQDIDGVDVLILRVPTNVNWNAGQHYFLTFPSLNFFESHTYTIANIPSGNNKGKTTQLYIIRAFSGQTKRQAKLCIEPGTEYPLPTLLCGAYGTSVFDPTAENIQLVAGGTGVSFTLPLAQELVSSRKRQVQRIDFLWIIRYHENFAWIQRELVELKPAAAEIKVELFIRTFITRAHSMDEKSPSDGNSLSSQEIETQVPTKLEADALKESDLETQTLDTQTSVIGKAVPKGTNNYDTAERLKDHHPNVKDLVTKFRENCVGSLQVLASGPPELGRGLREAVAACNDSSKVWRGDITGDVGLYWDCREY